MQAGENFFSKSGKYIKLAKKESRNFDGCRLKKSRINFI
jgi:hypothetical protein